MAESDFRGVHVLVVEDSNDTLELLREGLLQDLRPHAIVGDVTMPDDGVEFAR